MARRGPRCAAMLAAEFRHQQPWKKCCEQTAAHWLDGVPLCGTHFNAVFRGKIAVVIEIEADESDKIGAKDAGKS